MLKSQSTISHNSTESAENEAISDKSDPLEVIKLDNFAPRNGSAKSGIQNLIKHIVRETNRQKLNYDQLKYVFKAARERTEVKAPCKPNKLYELPTEDQLRAFYKVIENPIHRLIFEVLEGTGLRVAELCSLKVSRIDFQKNLVFVSKGKGQKDRVTIIGTKLIEKLRIYLEGRNNTFLFETNRHTKYSPRRVEQLCKEYKTKAGLEKDLTPHTFRHLWNTRLAEAGLSRERRAILAGHSNEQTQTIYTHLSAGGNKDEVIEILDRS